MDLDLHSSIFITKFVLQTQPTWGLFPVLTICTPLRNVLEEVSRSPPRLLPRSLRFLICLMSIKLSLRVL